MDGKMLHLKWFVNYDITNKSNEEMAPTELLFEEKKWLCKSGISGIFYPDNPQCHKNHGGGWLLSSVPAKWNSPP